LIQNIHPEPEINLIRTKAVRGSLYLSLLRVLLGMLAGVLVGYLITHGYWLIAAAVIAVVPLIIVLNAHPFSGIILLLLLMPFYLAFPNSSLAYWVLYRIFPVTILCLALLARIFKVRLLPPARLGPPEVAMGLFFLYVPAVMFFSQNYSGIALTHFSDRMLVPFCIYLAIRLIAPREKELIQLQWVALFIALSQSFIGFLSWSAPQFLPQVWLDLQGVRTTGSMVDPDLYATILTFSAAILVHAGVNRKPGWMRWIFFTAAGLCAIFAFLSLERAAWLGGIFVIIGLVILHPRTMLRLLTMGAILSAVLGTGILSAHLTLSFDRFSKLSPVYDRIVIFDAMLQMIQIKPALGWGYETLDQNIQTFYRSVGEATVSRIVTSHNTYLTILTELGMVGFILYLFPVGWWLVLSLRVWGRIPKERFWSRSLLASLWLVMLFNFTVSNFIDMRWFPFGSHLWWLVLGLIANMVYPYLKGRDIKMTAPVHMEYRSE
jgi:teichuronic acid biosynthesis protein TuaE